MASLTIRVCALALLLLFGDTVPTSSKAGSQNQKSQNPPPAPAGAASSKQAAPAKLPTPDEELQQAISSAGTDRATLVRNLEAFLEKYPEAQNRSQIYRALVEACIQLRDNARAADYAERIVALNPGDISITLLAIQLLERQKDEPGLRRAVSYATRVLD
jgi:hypothetical protein